MNSIAMESSGCSGERKFDTLKRIRRFEESLNDELVRVAKP